jgi:hypothetical protein
MIFHKIHTVLLVVWNHALLLFGGTTKTINMVDKMRNYATHGLKHNMILFNIVIHHKQMPSATTLALGSQPR